MPGPATYMVTATATSVGSVGEPVGVLELGLVSGGEGGVKDACSSGTEEAPAGRGAEGRDHGVGAALGLAEEGASASRGRWCWHSTGRRRSRPQFGRVSPT
ncbi:hypothetical protein B0J13DRAFT_532538 [Dactylonectria estremocensis]|uniref:Uncharacterized protein n=1 Tax=Dactylonectria estremocensis TaxID=1079267 RepID=A0A9P9IG51_9HYPO|nr:hypothetical protein B0J13DRAFT_532538 [Dactylonectria estremocensis]